METVRRLVSPEEWERRVSDAHGLAAVAARIEARVAGGEAERSAIRAEAPGVAETTWVKRLRL